MREKVCGSSSGCKQSTKVPLLQHSAPRAGQAAGFSGGLRNTSGVWFPLCHLLLEMFRTRVLIPLLDLKRKSNSLGRHWRRACAGGDGALLECSPPFPCSRMAFGSWSHLCLRAHISPAAPSAPVALLLVVLSLVFLTAQGALCLQQKYPLRSASCLRGLHRKDILKTTAGT